MRDRLESSSAVRTAAREVHLVANKRGLSQALKDVFGFNGEVPTDEIILLGQIEAKTRDIQHEPSAKRS